VRRRSADVYVTYDPPLPTRCETARARRIERHLLKRGQPGPRLRLGLTGTAAWGPLSIDPETARAIDFLSRT
jgi:hypothetical protein